MSAIKEKFRASCLSLCDGEWEVGKDLPKGVTFRRKVDGWLGMVSPDKGSQN